VRISFDDWEVNVVSMYIIRNFIFYKNEIPKSKYAQS